MFAAYYFPFSHPDPMNDRFHGNGWTEWELMRVAHPRFPDHRQPRAPQWGYEDDSDPEVMARKVKAASDHGLDAFVFDWYWFEGKPFLARSLDEGFLGMGETEFRFALMWANHDWSPMHPVSYHQASTGRIGRLFRGAVSDAEFDALCRHVIERYFLRPNYWRIDDKPYFSFYNLAALLESFGSVERTRGKLELFRERARNAGLPGLHLNAIEIFTPNIPHEEAVHEWPQLIHALGFDSVTSYSWAHFTEQLLDDAGRDRRTTYSYDGMDDRLDTLFREQKSKYEVPFFPHVTVGWDSSPRTVQSDKWENLGGGPFSFIWNDAGPEAFERYLALAAEHAAGENGGEDRPVLINAWNEWPECSYLEPDTEHGMAYLDAVRRVAARFPSPSEALSP